MAVKKIIEDRKVRALVRVVSMRTNRPGESTPDACNAGTFVTLDYKSTSSSVMGMDVVFTVPDEWKNKYTTIFFHTTNNHAGMAERDAANPKYARGGCIEIGHIYDAENICNDKIPVLIVEYR